MRRRRTKSRQKIVRWDAGVLRRAIRRPENGPRSRLTNSSSATEAGEDRLNHGKKPTASLCSLERVVRLPAYRGASGPPELAT